MSPSLTLFVASDDEFPGRSFHRQSPQSGRGCVSTGSGVVQSNTNEEGHHCARAGGKCTVYTNKVLLLAHAFTEYPFLLWYYYTTIINCSFNQAKPKTDVETRVYEVLSHKNWGASTSLLNQIAKDTFDYDKYAIIAELMWQSMENQRPAAWRVVFKALSLLEHLIKNGSERCVDDARNHGHALRALQQFNYYEGTIDRGLGVREKSKQLIDILSDDERVREERQKAKKLREKFGSKMGGVSGGGGGSSGGYGGNGGWEGGSSSGYGESGIGSERRNGGGGGRFDADPRGPAGGYGGRYDEDRGARTASAPEPTFAPLPEDRPKKSKSKKTHEPDPAPAPVIDLFSFDETPAPATASTTSAFNDDEFADFQGSSNQGGVDPFAAPVPVQQQNNTSFGAFASSQNSASQFDAFGGSNISSFGGGGMPQSSGSNGMIMGGTAGFNNNNNNSVTSGGMSNMTTKTVPSQTRAQVDDDDFGDFSAASSSKSPAAKSNDPFGTLISLDGLSLNNNTKKKNEDKLNAPVIANAAAATYIQEKDQIAQNVQQSKKGNVASFDGLVDLPKQSINGMGINMGMMNTASLGVSPSVMCSSNSSDAIGSIFDPVNLQQAQPRQSQPQSMGGMQQGFGGQPMMSGANNMMGFMNPQQQQMMAQMNPQQQQQMMLMMQQQMMQQQQQGGFGASGMNNQMGGF